MELTKLAEFKMEEVLIRAHGTQTFHFQPRVPMRLRNIRIDNEDRNLDIEFCQLGNIVLTAFARKYPIADVMQVIYVSVRNTGNEDLNAGIIVEGYIKDDAVTSKTLEQT